MYIDEITTVEPMLIIVYYLKVKNHVGYLQRLFFASSKEHFIHYRDYCPQTHSKTPSNILHSCIL